jgi:hypothetical protein
MTACLLLRLQLSVTLVPLAAPELIKQLWSIYCNISALMSDQEENPKVGSIQELWDEPVGSLEYSNQLIKKAVRSHQKLGLLMFTPFQANPKPRTGLYKVSRAIKDDARIASIVPVTNILQSIHLAPLPGRNLPLEWTSTTVMENCRSFLVNSFMDRQLRRRQGRT